MGCAPPVREFRPAGKHEARHVRAGLDLYFSADCEDARDDGEATSARTRGARAAQALSAVAKGDRLPPAMLAGVESLSAAVLCETSLAHWAVRVVV